MKPTTINIYSKEIIDFVKICQEYCLFMESEKKLSKKDFITKSLDLFPKLYQYATKLPKLESVLDEVNEKFVTEQNYNNIHNTILNFLGTSNNYPEVFDPVWQESDEPVSASLAENFADIYQDLKNFIILYGIGADEIKNDALWECQNNFEQFWGQKLVNGLRALHLIQYSDEISEKDPGNITGNSS